MAWHAVGWAPGLEIELAIRFDGTNWEDVTTDLRSFTTSISRSRALGLFPPGMGTFVLDNIAGNYTPLNASGDYYGDVLPGRHIRLRARYGSDVLGFGEGEELLINGSDFLLFGDGGTGTEYDVWYGIIQDWGDSYPQAKDGVATVSAVQPSALLAAYRGAAGSSVMGDGELSSARVSRVLTAMSWALGSSVETGLVPVQGSDLTSDGLTEVSSAVEAEFGALWCEPDGSLTFEARYALASNARSTTSQVTFGPGGGSEVPYLAVPEPVLSSGLDLVVNQATRANTGSDSSYTESDSTSISDLGAVYSDDSSRLIGTEDSWAQGQAQGMVLLYASPHQHPTTIALRPNASPDVCWAQALGRRIRDKVTVKVPTPWGSTLSVDCWLVGVSHTATPGDWQTVLEFEPAAALSSVDLFTLDSSALDGSDILGW